MKASSFEIFSTYHRADQEDTAADQAEWIARGYVLRFDEQGAPWWAPEVADRRTMCPHGMWTHRRCHECDLLGWRDDDGRYSQ